LKLAALYSGGKDSTFAIYLAKQEGHEVKCLVTIFPLSEESQFLHYPNISITKLQAKSMKLPHLYGSASSNDTKIEVSELESLLMQAKKEFGIEGIVHGGILSEFQKNYFESVCKKLIESDFKYIITSVSSEGLDDSWLGRVITHKDIDDLEKLAITHGFNLSFEGGEAESLVLNCPLFSMSLKIIKSNKIWDGYRGRFEITDVTLQ